MELYPHQVEALELVKDFNRCAIYYDMGLGKTYIGSEKIRQLKNKVNIVICQKSKINDWIDHFKNNYDFHIYNLTKPKELSEFAGQSQSSRNYIVGIINYDMVWRRNEFLHLEGFTMLLDESSLITNSNAKRSKYILKLNPANVILLSGTPTAGKYEKLISQINLLGWNITEDMFWKSYVDYKWVQDKDGYWEKELLGYKNVSHLKSKLAKYGAIFKKTEEVIDLPEQIEQTIYIDKDKKYRDFCKNSYVSIYKGPENDPIELIGKNGFTKLLYKRQLCGQYSPDKLKAFEDLVESTEDRLIVFYSFTEELDKLMTLVITKNLRDASRISQVNGMRRDLRAYEQYDDSITFVQYQAGAYGLNLQKANKIIYFTLPYGIGSCDLWAQSKKRIHRIGQNKPCLYYYLLVKDSIEERGIELLRLGKDLTDDLFETENNKDEDV